MLMKHDAHPGEVYNVPDASVEHHKSKGWKSAEPRHRPAPTPAEEDRDINRDADTKS